MDGPVGMPRFPSLNVTLLSTAACAAPVGVFFPLHPEDPSVIRFDHAAAAPQTIYRLEVIQ